MNHHTHTWHTISRERAVAWAINAGWGEDVIGPGPFKKCSGCRRFQGAPSLEGGPEDQIGLGFDKLSLEEGIISKETFQARWGTHVTS